jgi:REP element-mobilizing transposase RayT
MARQARIDAPGALHHIIIRGIERKAIFRDDRDRDRFLERLESVLVETLTPCYAWALMKNHAHLLLRTGVAPIATVMRRLLTGYAQDFNRRYRRHGQLFQNRYKSILCEEDPYLLELVRYIHLNPLRSKAVDSLKALASYGYGGHAVLVGKRVCEWQDRGYVLRLFAKTERRALRGYHEFMAAGIKQGRRPELVGGGLVRSVGGWSALKAYRSRGMRVKGDERILGSSEFVERVLELAEEEMEKKAKYQARGVDIGSLLRRTVAYYGVDLEEFKGKSKAAGSARARAVFCYLAVERLGESCASVARALAISPSGVSKAIRRGRSIVAGSSAEQALLAC